MSFFNRNKDNVSPRPDARADQYSRLPPRNQGLPPAPSQSRSYVPAGAAYEKQPYYQAQQPQGYADSGRFVVVKCPADDLALLNKLIVHPQGPFKDGEHVLVKDAFPVTVKHDNTRTLQINQVGATATQRMWMALTMSATDVPIRTVPPQISRTYLESLDLQVDFKKKRVEISASYSADEMAKIFLKIFGGTILAVGEPLVYEISGQIIEFTVKGLSVVDLGDNHGMKMGILMDKTDITVFKAEGSLLKLKGSAKKPPPNAILQSNFRFEDMGIGGLDEEFSSIFRRAFASRVFPPGLVEKLGIQHVKGILLYGPPGTGKTLMARQIGKMLNAREPKIVNGPEILNKYVGASEENIRKLFAEAEAEYKSKGEESGLHIIIFDELDAICKQRGSSGGSSGVGDSVVNQLLSKMDGVDQLNNILIIGMTNRKDMIDEALLRAGRLEVHMEINLPDEHGRLQILNIHTAKMRENHMMERDVNLQDLAVATKNFSGAEISGLIKSATSFAFTRHTKVGTTAGISDDAENLRVGKNDFDNALDEVKPMFGVSQEELSQVIQNGVIDYDPVVDALLHDGRLLIEQVRTSTRTPLVSVLLHGPSGSGKTALAATIAQASEFPFIKLISPESMVGYSPSQKIADINKVFSDSYKSPLSVIVIDNLERLLEWVNIGPNFSNPILQALLVLLHRIPPKGRRLLIIATTSIRSMLLDTELPQAFDKDIYVPPISTLPAFENVLRHLHLFRNDEELRYAMQLVAESGFGAGHSQGSGLVLGIKKLLSIIEMARQEPENSAARLKSALLDLRIQ